MRRTACGKPDVWGSDATSTRGVMCSPALASAKSTRCLMRLVLVSLQSEPVFRVEDHPQLLFRDERQPAPAPVEGATKSRAAPDVIDTRGVISSIANRSG